MTENGPTEAEKIEHDLAQLAGVGIGCPSAVRIKGPAHVREWADAELAAYEAEPEPEADPEALDEGETVGEFLDRQLREHEAPLAALSTGESVGAYLDRRLDEDLKDAGPTSAIDALAQVVADAQEPPEQPVAAPRQTMATLEEVEVLRHCFTALEENVLQAGREYATRRDAAFGELEGRLTRRLEAIEANVQALTTEPEPEAEAEAGAEPPKAKGRRARGK